MNALNSLEVVQKNAAPGISWLDCLIGVEKKAGFGRSRHDPANVVGDKMTISAI